MKLTTNRWVKRALFSGVVLAAAAGLSGVASAASMTDAGLEKRVSDLEREMALLKNRLKTMKDCDCDRIVRSGNSRVKVTLYGQVNRAVSVAISNRDAQVHHVDNDASSSRLGFLARGRISPNLTIAARIEVEWGDQQRSNTDDTTLGNTTVRSRKVELWITHKTFGTLWLGHGDPAATDADTVDLSGTDIVYGSAGCGDDGGLRFGPPNGTQGGGLMFGAACANFDSGRENRIMYETPSIGGFVAKVSHGEGDKFDAGLFYEGTPFGKDLQIAGGMGYQYSPGRKAAGNANSTTRVGVAGGAVAIVNATPGTAAANTNTYSGSIALLHNPTGLSFAAAGGINVSHAAASAVPRGEYWYVKVGWQGSMIAAGKTYTSIDFGSYDNITADVHAWAVGFAVVQEIDAAATDLYAGVRYQDAKSAGVGQDGVLSIITGVRIKF